MNLLTRDELRTLIEIQENPCISIFMPTKRAGAEIQENPIRLKNLLRETEKRLLNNGLRASATTEFLEPIQELLKERPFWQHQSDGLAIFLSEGFFSRYRLPLHFEDLAVINKRFYVKPLLPLFMDDGRFYILAISQNAVRLLNGTHYSVSEINLENIPKNLAEALKYDNPERQLQFHTTGTAQGRGERTAMFHGHGSGIDDAQDRILQYFRQIDKGLQELLRNEKAPLVLAGVDSLFPIYREANTYSHLLDAGIAGNPERLNAEELHNRAWKIVQPHFQETQKDAFDLYNQLANTQRASSDIREIVPAAFYGKVELLFVTVGFRQWGVFDQDANVVHLHQEEQSGDEELSDLAAIQTILNGGTVYAVEPEEMPVGAPLAAVFRY